MEIEKEQDLKASNCFTEVKLKTGKNTEDLQSNSSGDLSDSDTHVKRKRRCGIHVEDDDNSDDDFLKEIVPKVRKRSGSMSCYRKISADSNSTIHSTAKECANMVEMARQPVSSTASIVTTQFDDFPLASSLSRPPVIYEDSEPSCSDEESSSGRDSSEIERMKDSRIDYIESRKSGQTD